MPKRVEASICNIDELCGAGMCELYDAEKCFLVKAKLRARDADLVIINHAIALSGIVIADEDKEESLMRPSAEAAPKSYSHTVFPGEAKFIVFDEAHHLEDDATSAWECVISEGVMQLLLQQLYGRGGAKNLVDSVARMENDVHLLNLAKELEQNEGDLRLDVQSFFGKHLPQRIPEDENHENTVYRMLDEIPQDSEAKQAFISLASNLSSRLRGVKINLESVAEKAKSQKIEKILRTRARMVGRVVRSISIAIGNDKEYVRYLERIGSLIELKAAPLSVALYLKQFVYDNFSSVVLTSATLTVSKSFRFFANRCGTALVDSSKIDYHLFKSSFDFSKHCKFFVPKGISYSGKPEEHLRKSIPFIERAVIASGGGALILCSSHRQVDALYERLERPLAQHNIWLLRQSKGSSSNSVIRDFRKDINSTLVGTKTLWQGIDIPGESLRSLFIYKIPYDRPDNSLIKARCHEIDEKDGDSFAEYYEPLAALAIKQGFGRLIRKSTDTGIAIFLDEDLLKKHRILGSLPEGVSAVRAEPEEIFAALRKFTHQ
jgi:ATP-dependent DNA helicase DinG